MFTFPVAHFSSSGFEVDNSALFVKTDSEYLSADEGFGTPTNADIGTLSMWFKRASVGGSNLRLFTHGSGGSVQIQAYFKSDNKLVVGNGSEVTTTQTFASTTDWQNLVVRVDTSQGTAADRVRLYLNGSQITGFDAASYPSQNGNVFTSTGWRIGSWSNSTTHTFDGRMAEVIYVDGRSLAPTAFAENSGGTWVPIDPTDTVSVSTTAEAIANVTSATTGTGATNYAFSSVALGTAAANRAVYVFASGQDPEGDNVAVSSLTINVGGSDIAGSFVANVDSGAEAHYSSELWRVDVPTGTSGTVDVNWDQATSQCGIIVWAVTGDHLQYDLKTDTSNSTSSVSFTNVPDNSVILAGKAGTGGRRSTWSSAVDENVDEDIDSSGVYHTGASKAHSTGGSFTVTCTPDDTDTRPRMFAMVLSPTQGVGNNGFYLPFTDSTNLGADYSTGNAVYTTTTASSEWNGDTSDFSTLNTDIVAIGGNQGAIRTNDTFTGDFAFDFTWKGGANPAYVGVYEIDEDGTFSTGSSDGGMGSMTDSFYLFFTSGNNVNALKGSSTEASNIFTAASGEVVKFQRSGSEFKVFENGTLRHTFSGTSSNEVRILIGQSSSSLDWENFRWTNGNTKIGGGFLAVNSPTQSTDTPTS